MDGSVIMVEKFDYNDALKFIHKTEKFGSMPGLERIKKLLDILGNPQDSLQFVHIAGTNGKGSTTSYIASVLAECGYKCGRYISPYVVEFRERIQINGEFIPEKDLASKVLQVKNAIESEKELIITEFELITAAAFLYFKEQKCDVVCLEVGLGGRFDATNVIKTPLVSVITSISEDHTNILGDTISEIAMEKCGIIKEKGSVVSYPQIFEDARNMILKTARDKQNTVIFADKAEVEIKEQTLEGSSFSYKGDSFRVSLLGEHQVYNCITAIEALESLRGKGFSISQSSLKDGLLKTKFPARAEIISRSPLILLDGAHNADGIATLKKTLSLISEDKIFVVGMLKDKNYKASLGEIAPLAKKLYGVTPNNPRALSASELCECASRYIGDVCAYGDNIEALKTALSEAKEKGCALVVCGSLYLASELRPYLLKA